jgi:Uma2 family endonuclease
MSGATGAVLVRRARVTVVNEPSSITVPDSVVDLESFRQWTDADDFPEEGRICYLKGEVWVDMSKEQVFTHILVKTEITSVLRIIVKKARLGLLVGDGIFLSNVTADIGVNPDAVFVSTQSLQSRRARLIEGKEVGYVELEGTPDMVLEVVSQGSVRKDTVTLRQAYWDAGIPEYWLVDARTEPLAFEILRHTRKGYKAAHKSGEWMRSKVFGKAFRLKQYTDTLGHPDYTLGAR